MYLYRYMYVYISIYIHISPTNLHITELDVYITNISYSSWGKPTCLICGWDMTHSCVGHVLHVWDMTHSCVGHDVFMCGT